jgi:hypothetical protein
MVDWLGGFGEVVEIGIWIDSELLGCSWMRAVGMRMRWAMAILFICL